VAIRGFVSNNRTKRNMHCPPKNTPCGYCFSRWATCWDHLLPYSYRPNNSKSNLFPSCTRCNLVLSNKMFASLEEKREYVRSVLAERKLSALPKRLRKEQETSKVLFPTLQVAGVGGSAPSWNYQRRRYQRKKPPAIRPKPEPVPLADGEFRYDGKKVIRQLWRYIYEDVERERRQRYPGSRQQVWVS
jgi:hypothetical protein